MAVDPVCKMTVEPDKAAAKAEHRGTTYYFCSVGCQQAFLAEPESYIKAGGPASQSDEPTHHRH